MSHGFEKWLGLLRSVYQRWIITLGENQKKFFTIEQILSESAQIQTEKQLNEVEEIF